MQCDRTFCRGSVYTTAGNHHVCYEHYRKWVNADRPKTFFGRHRRTLIVFAVALFLSLVAYGSLAQGLALGKVFNVRAPVCKTQEAAVALAKLDHDQGPQAVVASINGGEDCGVGTFRARVVKVVYKNTTERGKDVRVLEVAVEMQDDSWKTFYILTDNPVEGHYET